MGKPNPADVVFWVLAALAVAAFGLFVLVLGGVLPIEAESGSGSAPVTQQAAPAAEPEREATTAPPERPEAERRSTAGSSTGGAARKPAPQLVTVVVTAARGDCWLSARAGSESGRLLDERILLEGESVRLRAPRVWLSLGDLAAREGLAGPERGAGLLRPPCIVILYSSIHPSTKGCA